MSIYKKFHIFFDMDGVLAKWPFPTHEEFSQPGYLRNLQPDASAICLHKILQTHGIVTQILTKVMVSDTIDPIAEKSDWLVEHVSQTEKPLFCPAEMSKAEMVKAVIQEYGKYAVLIDDWNQNLKEWQNAGGTAVKFLNGNNSPNSWNGRCLEGKEINSSTILVMLKQIDMDQTNINEKGFKKLCQI